MQALANQLPVDEAMYCYSVSLTQLCIYLENPIDPSASIYNKTAYVEAVVALYERLRGSDPRFSMNKGAFRMALTKAVIRDFSGQYSPTIRRHLSEFAFHGEGKEWSATDAERLGWHVQEMLSAGP